MNGGQIIRKSVDPLNKLRQSCDELKMNLFPDTLSPSSGPGGKLQHVPARSRNGHVTAGASF